MSYALEWETDFLGERTPVEQLSELATSELLRRTVRPQPAEDPLAERSSGVFGPVELELQAGSRTLQRGEQFDDDRQALRLFGAHPETKVRELWVRAVQNATETGHVDGIFADHSGTCERRSACHTALVVLTQGGWWWQGVTA